MIPTFQVIVQSSITVYIYISPELEALVLL
jgi:hypothetical protein